MSSVTMDLPERPKTFQSRFQKTVPYLLVAPVFLYYVIFWLRPVLRALFESFTALEGGFTFANYQMVFADPTFWPAVYTTAIITVLSVTLEFIVALILALLINEKFKGSGIFLFLAMIPMALPAVAAGAMWQTGLTSHGWMNSFLQYLGILEEGGKILFMTGDYVKNLILIILVDAWQVIPSVMIILLAGLQNLAPEMKEAGFVFGGDQLTVLRKITIPMMKPTITTAVILRLISAIQIWLIIVLLFGFNRLPVLLERVVYYKEEVPGLTYANQMAMSYTIMVTVVVSITALIYLKVSGAFNRDEEVQ